MKKNKEKILEIVRYFIVGVLTTLISLVVYYGLSFTILNPDNALQLQIANVISWVLSVLFAYVTNRIFVFKSKNENRLKEFTSFVGSRVLTLLMDMAIMFCGVTLIQMNDKFVKLASQVLVIVFNYVFSKLFVFQSREKKKKDYRKVWNSFLSASLFFFPFFLFLSFVFPSIVSKKIVFGVWVFYFCIFSFFLFFKKKYRFIIGCLFTFFIIQLCYVLMKGLSLFSEGFFLLEIFMCPLALLFFSNQKEFINYQMVTKVFYFTLLLFFLPFAFSYGISNPNYYVIKSEVSGLLCICLPIVLSVLYHHSNLLAKGIGFVLVFLVILLWHSVSLGVIFLFSALFLLWTERKDLKTRKFETSFLLVSILGIFLVLGSILFSRYSNSFSFEKILFDERFMLVKKGYQIFETANIEEQLFGFSNILEISFPMIRFDFIDIIYRIGIVGFCFYFIFLSYSFFGLRLKRFQILGIIFAFLLSFCTGSIFTSAFVGIYIGVLGATFSTSFSKKILLVTNMYPSRKYKHYGSFVKNTKESLEQFHYHVDVVSMKKQDTFLGKLIGYISLYFVSFWKSIFGSYDYYYVHFVSHSTFPVLLGRWTSFCTKLVCNVHGNDIVPDFDYEKKNVQKSQFALKFADVVVAPSCYFQDVLEKKYHIEKEKIKIYPSGGVDFSIFSSFSQEDCKKELGLDPSTTYYGYVSRIEKDKGWDTLLLALHKLNQEKLLKNIKVLVIGTGSEQKEFLKMIQEFHLEDFILQKEFVFQQDLVKYYHAMDLFLFPTRRKSESLGLVGLEAMASRTFVIGCNLYGPREYLIDQKNSFTFLEDLDGSILASKIKAFQKLRKERKEKMIENAYQTASRYDKNHFKDILQQIFD